MHRIGSSERPDLQLAVVVGAGGLGVAVARRMALAYRILLADVDGAKAEAEANRLRAEGCDVKATTCNVTSPDSVVGLVAVAGSLGGFQAVVQVAGLSPATGAFRQIVDVNLRGAALVANAFREVAREGSVAVLISSLSAHRYFPSSEMIKILRDPSAPDLPEKLERLFGEEAAGTGVGYPISKWGLEFLCSAASDSMGPQNGEDRFPVAGHDRHSHGRTRIRAQRNQEPEFRKDAAQARMYNARDRRCGGVPDLPAGILYFRYRSACAWRRYSSPARSVMITSSFLKIR